MRRPPHEVQVLRRNVHVAEDHAVRSQVEHMAVVVKLPVVELAVKHVPPAQDDSTSLWPYLASGIHEVNCLATPRLSFSRG